MLVCACVCAANVCDKNVNIFVSAHVHISLKYFLFAVEIISSSFDLKFDNKHDFYLTKYVNAVVKSVFARMTILEIVSNKGKNK